MSRKSCYLSDLDDFLEKCAIGRYEICKNRNFSESIISGSCTLEEAKKQAKKLNCVTSLVAELERIYTPQKQTTFVGNPAHYIIYCDDKDTSNAISKLLASALYSNGRLKSKHIIFTDIANETPSLLDDFCGLLQDGKFFEAQKGGALVISTGDVSDSNFARKGDFEIDELTSLIDKYKVETLSIIILNKGAKTLGQAIKNKLPKVRFVEIEEEKFFADTATELLLEKASADDIEDTASLIASIPSGNRAFCGKDVTEIYDTWLNARLVNEVYPQYKDIKCGSPDPIQPKSDSFLELQSLIGLKSAKSLIQQVLDYNKAQCLYQEAGLKGVYPSCHMVFTGNPGTAKTTVARLFADILRDNNILSRGDLIEVGRKDLVGKYVGWTAKLVEDAFKKAEGSVLFIDEAYSLCEEEGGLYGDEAINTIVQLMENQRCNTIVIFAGYPDKMQQFLDRNPGLRSRIAFNVNFDNYNTDELVEILQLFAAKNETILGSGVLERVRPIFDSAQKNPTFGNGRFVRNVFEQAKMRQASRLIRMDAASRTLQDIKTLLPEDFEQQQPLVLQEKQPIGFVC